MGPALGNWFFPNRNRVPSQGQQWDVFRTREHMVVRMNRRRSGVEGIYHCEIPDAMSVIKTMYIGVYSASNGEWSILLPNALNTRHIIMWVLVKCQSEVVLVRMCVCMYASS